MPRRKRRNKNFTSDSSSAKQIMSIMSDPQLQYWMGSGAITGVREKVLSINYSTLRQAVHKLPLVNSIINTRIDQLTPFCRYCNPQEVRNGVRGFTIVPKEVRSEEDFLDDPNLAKLGTFFEKTGFKPDPEREDDLVDYMQLFMRDSLEIDQIATEIQYNRANQVTAFWIVDGATVLRTNSDYPAYPEKRFAQVKDGKVYADYSYEQLLFDYKNKRTDLHYRGYGYAAVEMCIDLITTLLFGYNHTRDQFLKDKIPKGFLSVMGDVGQREMNAIQNYWYNAMSGAGGRWNIPIIPSGKEGVGLDFKAIGQNNRDMEYHKTMSFLNAIISSVFSIDLAELGLKSDDGSTPLFGEHVETKMKLSRDRGLSSLIFFFEQHLNKILERVSPGYNFRFVGLEQEDPKIKSDIRRKRLETDASINELRAEEGKPPMQGEQYDCVLNPMAVQIAESLRMEKMQLQAMGQTPDEGGEGWEEGMTTNDIPSPGEV